MSTTRARRTEPRPVEPMPWPYCQHPECHDPRTSQYGDWWPTGTSATDWSQVRPGVHIIINGTWNLPTYRRWCRIHALMFEGWSA